MSTIKSVVALITALIMALGTHLAPYFRIIKAGGMAKLYEDWSVSDEFTKDYCTEIKKDPNKDFVILNLADIQLVGLEPFNEVGDYTWKTIDKLVKDTKPDLITLTGDNATAMQAYVEVIKKIDSYGIPWAPVMGNHDGQNTAGGENWCALLFYEAKNCLFKLGPKDMGHGNYIINITENGKLIHQLYMMDTHSNTKKGDTLNGEDGYDNLWQNQMDWYKWAVNGTTKLEGGTVQSTVMMHIPLVEYDIAFNEAYDAEKGEYKGEYAETSFGYNGEGECCANNNNGFFTICKELGSTKEIVVGHDHKNCSSIVYDGIRLTYGLKTGAGSYHVPEMNGGTTITVSSDGTTVSQHHYVTP